MAAKKTIGWRFDEELIAQIKDFASARGLKDEEAAAHLVHKGLLAEKDADPVLKTALEAMQAARNRK